MLSMAAEDSGNARNRAEPDYDPLKRAEETDVHPAVMVSFSNPQNIKVLMRRLRDIRRDFADFEVEELVLYGKVEERLIKAGIECHSAHEPSCIPPEQV